MAKLIVNPTSSSRREIALPRSILSIGRDPSNDLVLSDAMVSRRHAVIEFRGSQFYLRDCNSSNGSLVNGDRVSERSLRDGDLVAIGTARLLFREEAAEEVAGGKVIPHPSSPKMQCPACAADYRKGDTFCRQCGMQLAQVPARLLCTACGTAVALPAKFCNACGRSLTSNEPAGATPLASAPAVSAAPPSEPPAPAAPPAAEAPAASIPVISQPEPGPDPKAILSIPEPRAVVHSPRPSRSSAAIAPVAALPAAAGASPRLQPRPEAALEAVGVAPVGVARMRRGGDVAFAPAGLGQRLGAAGIDSAIVAIGAALVLAPAGFYWWSIDLPRDEVSFVPILVSVGLVALVAVLAATYYVYYWGVRGATPGKQVLGIAVQGEDGAFPIGVSRALVRLLGYLLSGAVLGLGFVMVAVDGVGLHDRIAGTRVVRRGRA
jgi:uncharacterized RDD family membrane protein YckC